MLWLCIPCSVQYQAQASIICLYISIYTSTSICQSPCAEASAGVHRQHTTSYLINPCKRFWEPEYHGNRALLFIPTRAPAVSGWKSLWTSSCVSASCQLPAHPGRRAVAARCLLGVGLTVRSIGLELTTVPLAPRPNAAPQATSSATSAGAAASTSSRPS